MLRVFAVLAFVLLACTVGSATATPKPPNRDPATRLAYAATLVIRDMGPFSLPLQPVCGAVRVAPLVAVTAYHCTVAASHTPAEWKALTSTGRNLDEDPPDTRGRRLWLSSFAAWQAAGGDWTEMDVQSAVVESLDVYSDAAVLTLAYPGPHVQIAPATQPGQPIFAVHHSYGLPYSYGVGVVAAPVRSIDLNGVGRVEVLQVDVGVHQGASGSGIFDADGRLVGVARAILQPAGIALYVPASELRGLL